LVTLEQNKWGTLELESEKSGNHLSKSGEWLINTLNDIDYKVFCLVCRFSIKVFQNTISINFYFNNF